MSEKDKAWSNEIEPEVPPTIEKFLRDFEPPPGVSYPPQWTYTSVVEEMPRYAPRLDYSATDGIYRYTYTDSSSGPVFTRVSDDTSGNIWYRTVRDDSD